MQKKIKIPKKIKTSLTIWERIKLCRAGKSDAKSKAFESCEGDNPKIYVSPFMNEELNEYFAYRDYLFSCLVVTLYCKDKDKDLAFCKRILENPNDPELDSHGIYTGYVFAEAMANINAEIDDLDKELVTIDTTDMWSAIERKYPELVKVIREKEDLFSFITKKEDEFTCRIELRDKRYKINSEEKSKYDNVLSHINSKERLINKMEDLLNGYFKMRMLRISYYWKVARNAAHKFHGDSYSLPVDVPPGKVLIERCGQTLLGDIDGERAHAKSQRDFYIERRNKFTVPKITLGGVDV